MDMQKKCLVMVQVIVLALLLPCLYGCQGDGSSGGGGSASLSSFAFGASGDAGSLSSLADPSSSDSSSGTDTTAGTQLATIHNPEPATMLLLGSGMAAMMIRRRKQNRS